MVVVHHLNNSRSHRIVWLLEELGLAYRIERHARDPATYLAPESLRAVHPLGKAPVVVDGDTTLAESGAIIEYLTEKHGGGLAPARDAPERQAYIYWLHHAEGSAMPALVMHFVFDAMARRAPFLVRPVVRAVSARAKATLTGPMIARCMDLWSGTLAAGGWFAGSNFSAADIQMSYPVEAAAKRIGLGASHGAIADFIGRIRARPAYQRALAASGDAEAVL
jgi:glutathione S-transferase